MFKKMLSDKSEVQINNGRWQISKKYNEYNQAGSKGRDDLIRRQDAVQLIGEMNLKLVNIYSEAKEQNPKLADELLQVTTILSYAMWGIRELEPSNQEEDK